MGRTRVGNEINLSYIQQKLEEAMKVVLSSVLSFFMVMLLSSCETSTDPVVDELDPEGAIAKVELANTAWESELFFFTQELQCHRLCA